MPKMKQIIVSLLAVSIIGAFAPALATAAIHVFFVEGTELTSTEAVEGANGFGLQKIETEVAGLKIIKECEEDLGTGIIGTKGESRGKIEGKNCHLYEQSKAGKKIALTNCTLKEPLIAEFTGLLTGAGLGEVKGSGSEESFIELEIKGEACALKGKFKIKGSEVCASPEATLEKAIHKGICTPAASKLNQKGTEENGARLFGTGISKLKSGKKWSST
jgi:hypothetical protein